jgi:hypothetical protein
MENKDEVYTFTQMYGDTEYEEFEVREEDLTSAQKAFLFAELIEQWNYSPKDVQSRFLNELTYQIKQQNQELFTKDMMDSLAKRLMEDGE